MHFAALRTWLRRGHPGPPEASDADVPPDAASAEPGGDVPAMPDSAATPEPAAAPTWPASRLAVAEELWGSGFLNPGGADEVLRLATPIGLSAASTLLLLGVGAGGPAQALATERGIWVAGFEADPELAVLAARRIQRAGDALAKRATVAPWDPAAPRFRPRLANHALGLDAIRDAPPAPALAAIAGALRPHGHIVLSETVTTEPLDPDDPAIAMWCRLEGRRPCLPEPEAVTRGLSRLGFDVRVVEDISARHMRLAVLGWRHFVRLMARERPDHERAAAVVEQAELWTRRIRLMHSGRIRLMRWHAIGPATPLVAEGEAQGPRA
ncbi:MAG: hypothetical protein IT555_04610 [Acetobacteraceae bacterium]|nr:hypothetical protein [Acetobacteraceae bacterium]